MLALGSNLGDRLGHLRAAVAFLDQHVVVRGVSPVYETTPVGGPEQGSFLNAVLLADAELEAAGWLALALAAEAAAGRVRDVRWGPRTLDVDVIEVAVGSGRDPVVMSSPELTLPHPRAAGRAFVLIPWLAADPEAVLCGHGRVAELVGALDCSGVHRRDDLGLLR